MGVKLTKRFLIKAFMVTILTFLPGTSSLVINDLKADVLEGDYNIILITIDTLRSDHLSCYGYERKTSPNIDKIADNGIIFKKAIAPSSWTAPSMVSLFTSVYPINHGIVQGVIKGGETLRQEVFSDELVTFTQILKEKGYSTFGVASNLHLSEKLGFARGFDNFQCLSFLPAPVVNKIFNSWEKEIKKSDKFFIWAHYIDPHIPYSAKSPWIEKYASKELTQKLALFRKNLRGLNKLIPEMQKDPQVLSSLIALYDSEINFIDSYVGELIQKFSSDNNTLIIITSDHGEGFLEHGHLSHGNSLYSENINIPLIIKLPKQMNSKSIGQQVSLLDVMPTILSLLNLSFPDQVLGESLITSEGEERRIPKRFLFSELGRFNYDQKAIFTDEWKYIYNYTSFFESLFNRTNDLGDKVNLVSDQSAMRNRLKDSLNKWVEAAHKYPPKKVEVTPSQETVDKLKSLGYIE
jgi:choline-sulfatase